jgi:outer membrane usher protein
VRRSNGALLKVVRENGKPLPAGSVLRVEGNPQSFPVGIDGGVYLIDLGASNRVHAQNDGQACEFDLAFQPTTEPLPNLGTFVCHEVTR